MKRCPHIRGCCEEDLPSAGSVLASKFTCENKCNYAASEWSHSHLARAGALNLTTGLRLVTFVREPIAWFRSKIEHDLTFPHSTGAAPEDRYHSVNEALSQAENGTGYAKFFPNFQSHRALAPQRMVGGTATRSSALNRSAMSANHVQGANKAANLKRALRADYFFVGLTEWMWHSLCVLDYRMGVFDGATCDCKNSSAAMPFVKNPIRPNQQPVQVLYTSAQMKRAQALLRHDALLYAAALQNLRESVEEVERETGVDLLQCFSSRRA